MAHIFISYSKQNLDFARYLRALLESEHFAVWMDEVQLTPSSRWWKSIEQNIKSCAALVVIMSPEAYDSDWVERELLLAEANKKPLFPVLLAGDPWARLANIQYEDLRAGLHAKLSARFVQSLNTAVPRQSAQPRLIEFRIQEGDLMVFEADVVALKHAQRFLGADEFVASVLVKWAEVTEADLAVSPGAYCLVETKGALSAPHALFVGTPPPRDFGYPQIRELAARVLQVLAQELPETRHLAMTIHGLGFSLDEAESLRSQFAGYWDAFQAGQFPPALEHITILEINNRRRGVLQSTMEQEFAAADFATRLEGDWAYQLRLPELAQPDTRTLPEIPLEPAKRHAFVVLPPDEDLEDIFYYGIQSPVHACGLLCERLEPPIATDDWLEQIKKRIETASVVIADLTAADPRVYLQLGYAWGKGRPVILLAKAGAPSLLATTAPAFYHKIKDVETALSSALDALKGQGRF
ncbi:MAG TPA: toll/interleukin-1 receptor domain-containing protein [Phototrophicaceae bacterium]|nr:toll/interleukin-1 receptor domain-containing protein [Phototrophicaceae bacterium]